MLTELVGEAKPDEYPMSASKTLRLYQRSILEGWRLPEDTKRMVAATAAEVLANPESRTRDRHNAAKLLDRMLEREHNEMRSMTELTIRSEIAAVLGATQTGLAHMDEPSVLEDMTDDEPQGGSQ